MTKDNMLLFRLGGGAVKIAPLNSKLDESWWLNG